MQAGQTQVLTLAVISRAKAVVRVGATALDTRPLGHVGPRGLDASRRLEQIRFGAVPQRTALSTRQAIDHAAIDHRAQEVQLLSGAVCDK